jgi:hypothetical protein
MSEPSEPPSLELVARYANQILAELRGLRAEVAALIERLSRLETREPGLYGLLPPEEDR